MRKTAKKWRAISGYPKLSSIDWVRFKENAVKKGNKWKLRKLK